MSIRNLGDWSPLGLGSDPVHADPDVVADAQTRYQNIASTIEDAVTRLGRIVDANSESLAGQYVQGLQSSASSLKDSLSKASVRYSDVASQIQTYEPELTEGLSETAGALNDARTAVEAQTSAQGLPDPQKNSDGTLTAQGQQQSTAKTNAVNQANDQLSAAKARLNNAMDNLNAAGKRFGDAVNSKNYKDGLTDTLKDKIDAVFAEISKIFGAIGMVLAGLAMLIPGVDAIVLAGVVAGVVALVANSVLLADGKGSVLDVVLGAVGLGMAGAGTFASQLLKGLSAGAREVATAARVGEDAVIPGGGLDFQPGALGEDIELGSLARPAGTAAGHVAPADMTVTFQVMPRNAATDWTNMSEWYNNPLTNAAIRGLGGQTPDIGFWESAGYQIQDAGKLWGKVFSDPAGFLKDWTGAIGGWSGYREFAGVMGAVGRTISPMWYAWGGVGLAWGLGAGLGYTGGRLNGNIPSIHVS